MAIDEENDRAMLEAVGPHCCHGKRQRRTQENRQTPSRNEESGVAHTIRGVGFKIMFSYKIGISAQNTTSFVTAHPQANLRATAWAQIRTAGEIAGLYKDSHLVAAASVPGKPLYMGMTMLISPHGPIGLAFDKELLTFVWRRSKFAKEKKALFVRV